MLPRTISKGQSHLRPLTQDYNLRGCGTHFRYLEVFDKNQKGPSPTVESLSCKSRLHRRKILEKRILPRQRHFLKQTEKKKRAAPGRAWPPGYDLSALATQPGLGSVVSCFASSLPLTSRHHPGSHGFRKFHSPCHSPPPRHSTAGFHSPSHSPPPHDFSAPLTHSHGPLTKKKACLTVVAQSLVRSRGVLEWTLGRTPS